MSPCWPTDWLLSARPSIVSPGWKRPASIRRCTRNSPAAFPLTTTCQRSPADATASTPAQHALRRRAVRRDRSPPRGALSDHRGQVAPIGSSFSPFPRLLHTPPQTHRRTDRVAPYPNQRRAPLHLPIARLFHRLPRNLLVPRANRPRRERRVEPQLRPLRLQLPTRQAGSSAMGPSRGAGRAGSGTSRGWRVSAASIRDPRRQPPRYRS